jgi:hypothetical protein
VLTWLADVLRGAGLGVVEVPGWETRGHGVPGPILGVLLHHTAGPASGNYPSLPVVRDGRPGLAGPLANLGLARDGTWYVIAGGVAWHAGAGTIPWIPADQGNQHLIGVEAESTGILTAGKADWTPQQLNSYPRGVAALLNYLALPSSRAIAHREWAPGRKVDPVGIDMPTFRAQVAALMTVPPVSEDDVSWTHDEGAPTIPDFYPGAKGPLPDPATALAWAAAHAAVARDVARAAGNKVDALRADVAALRAEVALLKGGIPSGDPAAFATAVAVELAARLKEK